MTKSKSEETQEAAKALETAGREYGKHSGPRSTELERDAFSRDLRVAALRYARAYQAEARELGLVPEYERVKCKKYEPALGQWTNVHAARARCAELLSAHINVARTTAASITAADIDDDVINEAIAQLDTDIAILHAALKIRRGPLAAKMRESAAEIIRARNIEVFK